MPFAKDIDGNLQCVGIKDDGSETVLACDGAGKVEENLNVTYGEYLEEMRDKMMTGRLEYDEDMGLMEC